MLDPYSQPKRPQQPLYVPSGSIRFRILCHSSRVGGIIGKSGSIIKLLQSQTSAKLRVEPPSLLLPLSHSLDDSVIVVIANADVAESGVSAAQEAVLRVFERVVEVAAESDEVGGVVSCRLLVEGANVGAVMGKGGSIVKKIRADFGCKIRVFGPDNKTPGSGCAFPDDEIVEVETLVMKKIRADCGCIIRVFGPDNKVSASAFPDDEIVEIEGEFLAVKKALVAVTRCIQDKTSVDKLRRGGNQSFETIPRDPLPNGHGFVRSDQTSVVQPMPHSFGNYASGDVISGPQQRDVVFRMLCSVDMVGSVIGKGGSIHQTLQQETGALVVIGPYIHECLERSISVSAMESSDSINSPAQNAFLRVYDRIIEAASEKGIDSGSSTVSARLLVSPNQVGCLLGKGGSIVSDMRKTTGTCIWVIGNDQVPKCASENDEVVQITGEVTNVRHALHVVTGKLRDNLFSSKMSNGFGTRSNPATTNGNMIHEKSRGPPPIGLRASASSSQILRHTNLTESMDHLRLNNYDQTSSPRSLASQHTAAEVNSGNNGDVKQLASVKGGVELGSGSRCAIVMNTTVEIIVPDNIIGSVYGENGSNLTQLREISGAKVVVHEPRPGTTDRIVIISGTPDETQAAQSLLQAFILTGQS